jgi:hypothetical protein
MGHAGQLVGEPGVRIPDGPPDFPLRGNFSRFDVMAGSRVGDV